MYSNNDSKEEHNKEEIQFQQNSLDPGSEDIYNNSTQEADIDPANTDALKTPNEENEIESVDENRFKLDETGNGLDIPGAELDNEEEAVGSEDEENNYYSIGGDNHTDLEETEAD